MSVDLILHYGPTAIMETSVSIYLKFLLHVCSLDESAFISTVAK